MDGQPGRAGAGAGRRVPGRHGGRVRGGWAFAEVASPYLVVFSWGFADEEAAAHTKHAPGEAPPGGGTMPAGSTRVAVTLTDEDGGTRVTLRHENLPSEELRAAHDVAWHTYLPRLAVVAAGGDPGPDPHA